MKITKIEIKDFHQFKDLTIDLTYPKGHAKEGQPLDKVCFIGQSGTGKTTLLELIPKFLANYDTPFINKSGLKSIIDKIQIDMVFGLQKEYYGSIFVSTSSNENIARKLENAQYKNQVESTKIVTDAFAKWKTDTSTKLIYFPANLSFDIEVGNENTLNDKAIIDFSTEKVSLIWNLILDKIQKYQEQELQIRQEISKIVEQSSNNLDTIQKALKKLEDWKRTEFNPIQDIADNCLNNLLIPFKLRVKTELDIKSKDDIGFIKIEDYDGNEIPHGLWSTGTKQVVLSSMPLYLLKPKHTVILFDEPERSLYPDMQRFIIDYYSSLTENCQFFYSTHSPIIASNFEPWEIVELKFNKEGKIYRELYYNGENHVDNYKWNPKYMRWDDILQRIFDMDSDGGKERKDKLDELASNNIKLKKLKEKGGIESAEGKLIFENVLRLSKELSYWG